MLLYCSKFSDSHPSKKVGEMLTALPRNRVSNLLCIANVIGLYLC